MMTPNRVISWRFSNEVARVVKTIQKKEKYETREI